MDTHGLRRNVWISRAAVFNHVLGGNLVYNVLYATVAQLVEQLICNQQVVGSSPISGSTFIAGVRSYRQGHRVVTPKVAGSSPAAPAKIQIEGCSNV